MTAEYNGVRGQARVVGSRAEAAFPAAAAYPFNSSAFLQSQALSSRQIQTGPAAGFSPPATALVVSSPLQDNRHSTYLDPHAPPPLTHDLVMRLQSQFHDLHASANSTQ